MPEVLANNAASTLSVAIAGAGDATCTVTNGAVFPATGNFRIIVDSEIMLVTARAANVLTITRGQETTTAVAHSNGAAVTHVLTKGGLDSYALVQTLADAKGDIIAATGADVMTRLAVGANGTVLTADSAQATGLSWAALGGAGAWSSYVPALTAVTTNPTLGSGGGFTQVGRYVQFGKLVVGVVRLVFGTSGATAGSGVYAVSLPVTALTTIGVAPIGIARIYDSSTTNLGSPNVFLATSTTVNFNYAATYLGTNTQMGNAAPWTWAATDEINFFFLYEAA